MKWLCQVWKELSSPDNQTNNWYGWATNQTGHTLIGLLATWLVSAGLGVPPLFGLLAVVALYVSKEVADVRKNRDIVDSATDAYFVSVGAFLAVQQYYADFTGFTAGLAALLVSLLFGIRARMK